MQVLLTEDQITDVKNLLCATIANKELNGVKAIQEREILHRLNIATLANNHRAAQNNLLNKLVKLNKAAN
jgi:hypothetical protein